VVSRFFVLGREWRGDTLGERLEKKSFLRTVPVERVAGRSSVEAISSRFVFVFVVVSCSCGCMCVWRRFCTNAR